MIAVGRETRPVSVVASKVPLAILNGDFPDRPSSAMATSST
jgi:hypothetical protein